MAGRGEPGVGRAGVEAETAALAAVDGDGIAARRIGPRGRGGDGKAPGERRAGDGERRLRRAPGGDGHRLGVRLAHAAVRRDPVELHRMAGRGEPGVGRAGVEAETAALAAVDGAGVAGGGKGPRGGYGHREVDGWGWDRKSTRVNSRRG